MEIKGSEVVSSLQFAPESVARTRKQFKAFLHNYPSYFPSSVASFTAIPNGASETKQLSRLTATVCHSY